MKPARSLIVGVNVAAVGILAWAVSGDITGSAHDFSQPGYTFSDGEICKPCHIPHNANVDVEAAPLWNHELTTATYATHETPGGGVPVADALDQGSILCMSCHDGTVALDAFGGGNGTAGTLQGSANLTTDLTNDHPVGADAIYANFPWLEPPETWEGRNAGNPRKFTLKDADFDGDGVPERVVGCSTCHEPHNGENQDHMLQLPMQGSQLCQECHSK